jgi:hypothetical protein
MSIATALYRELTGSDDRDAYAPPLYACLISLLFLVPWKKVFIFLGVVILIWIEVVLFLI